MKDMKSPTKAGAAAGAKSLAERIRAQTGQIVLVLQGGGALGAYQAGVYEALHEAGIEPDWVIGTSIGAINASLIAGNEPKDRLAALRAFWARVTRGSPVDAFFGMFPVAPSPAYWTTLFGGLGGFFKPHLPAFLGAHARLDPEQAGYYSTAPLRETLSELVDVGRLNGCMPRLTVGAAEVRTSRMRYFDSRDGAIGLDHILASGALPPAFPAVRIDGELYWDGGVLSNTPTEVIFDDNPRQSGLIFAVHLWNPMGDEPRTIWQVMHRQKDIQYSSRVAGHISRQMTAHRLRHIINRLGAMLPPEAKDSPEVREMLGWGCQTRMHVVRLLAPTLDHEDQTKDVDFSASGVRKRWAAGLADTRRVLEARPWEGPSDPMAGVVLHEPPGAE
jgi:NTE family protein